jgi:3-hydroxyisobutyrate dehydrogenase-like beta-hydroxyacid dehydrogenase
MENIGLIGLGHMGKAVSRRLLVAGYPLTLYNRTPSKLAQFIQQGAEKAATPAELAQKCDVVITIVSDDDALEAVALGGGGIAEGVKEGGIVVDMSTLTAATLNRVDAALSERGAELLHAPILGGPMNVFMGSATITAGGGRETFHRILPLLEAISKPVFFVGPLEKGSYMKLALNIMLTHFVTGLSSSLAFANKTGLDPELVLNTLIGAARPVVQRVGEKMLSGDRSATFYFRNLAKDQRYFLETAGEFGLALPTIEAAEKYFEQAVSEGWGDDDFTAIYRYMLQEQPD